MHSVSAMHSAYTWWQPHDPITHSLKACRDPGGGEGGGFGEMVVYKLDRTSHVSWSLILIDHQGVHTDRGCVVQSSILESCCCVTQTGPGVSLTMLLG